MLASKITLANNARARSTPPTLPRKIAAARIVKTIQRVFDSVIDTAEPGTDESSCYER